MYFHDDYAGPLLEGVALGPPGPLKAFRSSVEAQITTGRESRYSATLTFRSIRGHVSACRALLAVPCGTWSAREPRDVDAAGPCDTRRAPLGMGRSRRTGTCRLAARRFAPLLDLAHASPCIVALRVATDAAFHARRRHALPALMGALVRALIAAFPSLRGRDLGAASTGPPKKGGLCGRSGRQFTASGQLT